MLNNKLPNRTLNILVTFRIFDHTVDFEHKQQNPLKEPSTIEISPTLILKYKLLRECISFEITISYILIELYILQYLSYLLQNSTISFLTQVLGSNRYLYLKLKLNIYKKTVKQFNIRFFDRKMNLSSILKYLII